MAHPMVPNNFKFRYFFGVQIPTKNLIPPVANLVSCNVLESNNTNSKKNFLHALELQSSSLEIFDVNPIAMFETVVIDVDDECVPFLEIPKKVVVNVNCEFQKTWAMKMPWVEPIFHEVGLVSTMRCPIYTKIERKGKNWVVKWNFIIKHPNKKKGSDGKWIMDPKCMHVKNEISYVQLFTTIIF
jgi:hypothetical protein